MIELQVILLLIYLYWYFNIKCKNDCILVQLKAES